MHPVVEQLRFTRSEFRRVFEAVSDEDGRKRLLPMNSLGWIVAHLALQEQRYWTHHAQGLEAVKNPQLIGLAGYPDSATTPDLSVVLPIWDEVMAAADTFLNGVDDAKLLEHFEIDGEPHSENIGTLMLRNIYHYWYHTGEAHAIRQQLGHADLPSYVGDLSRAPFR